MSRLLQETLPDEKLRINNPYELFPSQPGSRLSMYVDEKSAVYVSASYDSAPPHLRFLSPCAANGKSPFTWNALRYVAFAIHLKQDPTTREKCTGEYMHEVCDFLHTHYQQIVPSRGTTRPHDHYDEGDMGHIHLWQEGKEMYVSTRRILYQNSQPACLTAPSNGDSPVVWNAFIMLAHAISMDSSPAH